MQKIFEAGVSVDAHFQPLPLLTVCEKEGHQMSDHPEAWTKHENEISLPVHFDLTDGNVRTITEAVIKAAEEQSFALICFSFQQGSN